MPSRRPSPALAYIVRHAKAGDRNKWVAPDQFRPLTPGGVKQARGIAKLLRNEPVGHIVSSASARCVQTIEPLARALGKRIETADELYEGAGPHGALRLAAAESKTNGVLCTHGDIVYLLLELIDLTKTRRLAKGSTWVLEFDGDEPVRARYLPPPA